MEHENNIKKKRGRRKIYTSKNEWPSLKRRSLSMCLNLSEEYENFLNKITIKNPNSVKRVEFFRDMLVVFKETTDSNPKKLEEFLGYPLYKKYFKHLEKRTNK